MIVVPVQAGVGSDSPGSGLLFQPFSLFTSVQPSNVIRLTWTDYNVAQPEDSFEIQVRSEALNAPSGAYSPAGTRGHDTPDTGPQTYTWDSASLTTARYYQYRVRTVRGSDTSVWVESDVRYLP